MGHGDYISGLNSDPTYINNSLLINNQLKVPYEHHQVWSDSQWMKCATEKGISSEKRKLLLTSGTADSKTLPSQPSPENEYASIDDELKISFDSNFLKKKNRDSFKSMSTFSGFIPTLSNNVLGNSPEPYATTDLLLSNRNSNNSNGSGNNNTPNGQIYGVSDISFLLSIRFIFYVSRNTRLERDIIFSFKMLGKKIPDFLNSIFHFSLKDFPVNVIT
jgi:hypothetical protein